MKVKSRNLLLGLMGGLWLATFAPPTAAEIPTESWQLAQGEPLPPLPWGNPSVPSVVVPQNSDVPVDLNFTDPDFSNDIATGESKFYLVYIPGQSQQTLDQVRLYEPEAFFAEYKGRMVIQAGIFANRYNAERLARELEFAGVRSAIATLSQPSTTVASTAVAPGFTTPPVASADNLPPTNNSLATPPIGTSFALPAAVGVPPGNVNLSNGYFVVIPGNRQELASKIQLAIDAGISPDDIFTREEPFGPHVAIGPFPNRTTAEQESGYLQKFGIDARIYFED